MRPERINEARVDDELDVLAALVPVAGRDIVELGCGAATLARALLARHPDSRVTGLEVDERQHAKNLASPQPGLQFVAAGAQSIPAADASFDMALMRNGSTRRPAAARASAMPMHSPVSVAVSPRCVSAPKACSAGPGRLLCSAALKARSRRTRMVPWRSCSEQSAAPVVAGLPSTSRGRPEMQAQPERVL